MTPRARVGVLLSGRGSNFLALHEAISRGEVPAEIVIVLSDRPSAPGLERARELGYPVRAVPPLSGATREEHEDLLLQALRAAQVGWICLAGYLRILTRHLVSAYPSRILNIHPSLLPAFPGLHAQRQAVEHGVRIAGCTVHLVDEGLDSGPIVVQRAVPVADGDDESTLAARILRLEHEAYPEALRRLLSEPWEVCGRRLVFAPQGPAATKTTSVKKGVDTPGAPPYNLPSRDGKPQRDDL